MRENVMKWKIIPSPTFTMLEKNDDDDKEKKKKTKERGEGK